MTETIVLFTRQTFGHAEVANLAAYVIADQANLSAIERSVADWEAGRGSMVELDRWELAKTGVRVGLLAAGHEVDE